MVISSTIISHWILHFLTAKWPSWIRAVDLALGRGLHRWAGTWKWRYDRTRSPLELAGLHVAGTQKQQSISVRLDYFDSKMMLFPTDFNEISTTTTEWSPGYRTCWSRALQGASCWKPLGTWWRLLRRPAFCPLCSSSTNGNIYRPWSTMFARTASWHQAVEWIWMERPLKTILPISWTSFPFTHDIHATSR